MTPALPVITLTHMDLLGESQGAFRTSRSPNTAGTEELVTRHMIFTQR